ncbi:Superoxide dismutase Mn, mitochondrial [Hondaea fermentalgiana]|uniref:Superoxide dismutase n=1 Tax=Hondaea fermentalgiana TaxID=2315210 RepID=A0A2R5GP99_9STRA|nr:Superoxide dismutase Mn, mitochondrial [Hondaea fermentalgiana]|eukprot:GBG29704.1 Superoxide dismutase Mn, mitochondrial [Hondaea fermentalgiana]
MLARASAAKTLLARAGTRQMSAASLAGTFKLPDLDYDYGALEPHVSAKIMEVHHTKHHQAYVTNLNATLEKYAEAEEKGDMATMIALQTPLKFNGGGHVNHCLFWDNLAPPSSGGGGEPSGDIGSAIQNKWGGFEDFKKEFAAKAVGVQGSGWCWLAWDPTEKSVRIVTTANQDPCSTTGCKPLLGLDVWEHAYWWDVQNRRPEYIENSWNIYNWSKVEERFKAAK